MQNILAKKTIGLTELRESTKVLLEAGGEPIAVMNRNQVSYYMVPAEAVNRFEVTFASRDEAMAAFKARKSATAKGRAYLKDK